MRLETLRKCWTGACVKEMSESHGHEPAWREGRQKPNFLSTRPCHIDTRS